MPKGEIEIHPFLAKGITKNAKKLILGSFPVYAITKPDNEKKREIRFVNSFVHFFYGSCYNHFWGLYRLYIDHNINLPVNINQIIKSLNDNKIAIFGTGHAACLFVNLFNLKGLIDIAVDDNKKKIGYFIPGSNIPICSSKNLNSKKINLCILCVSSDSERKIIKKNVLFKKNGGIFVSIYPSSKYAI